MTQAEFSPRERQVIGLIAAGYQDHEIAAEMIFGLSTVKDWKCRIYRKLGGARNAAQAVHLAYQAGLFDLDRSVVEATAEDLALVLHAREMGYRIALAPLASGRRPCVNCADASCGGCWGVDTHRVDDWDPS